MEKKKDATEGKISAKKQKGLRVLSKILEVFSRIGIVVCYIALVCIILVGIATPLLMKNVTIGENEIGYKDKKVFFEEIDDDEFAIKYEGSKYGTIKVTEKEEFFRILDKLSINKITAIIEVGIVTGIIIIILTVIMLKKFVELMKNIRKRGTPFVEENPGLMRTIAKLMIATMVITWVSALIVSAISSSTVTIKIDFGSVGVILLIFMISFIFDYGYELQKESNSIIYDVNE